MQDWITIQGAAGILSVTQSEPAWINLEEFQDVVFSIQGTFVNKGGASNMIMYYETAPVKDESLFAIMGQTDVPVAVGPVVTPILLAGLPSFPLAKWVRWRIAPSGTLTSAWSACFRIHLHANKVS
jgi:hypothetical protein